jgi:hypothetical protein
MSYAAVAAGVQGSVEDVEALCEELAAQQHFFADAGLTVWPDGTHGGSYRFQHTLYRQVLYERLGTMRRMHLHRRIGAGLEAGYGPRAREIAPQLAVHFERGARRPEPSTVGRRFSPEPTPSATRSERRCSASGSYKACIEAMPHGGSWVPPAS